MAMTKKEKLKHCAGCDDDFYNGNNPLGVSECWSLNDAKLVWKREIHISQCPPFTQKPRRFFNCYRRPQYVYVKKEVA